jgi:putative FmdB family regulatory protein
MPIYEYECSKCGKTIEVIQKFSDKPLKKHAGCGGTLTKLISASGFQFKGTGWYVTDYARKGKSEGKSEGTESSKKDSKETSSNDNKKEGSADKPASPKSDKKDSSSKTGGSKD